MNKLRGIIRRNEVCVRDAQEVIGSSKWNLIEQQMKKTKGPMEQSTHSEKNDSAEDPTTSDDDSDLSDFDGHDDHDACLLRDRRQHDPLNEDLRSIDDSDSDDSDEDLDDAGDDIDIRLNEAYNLILPLPSILGMSIFEDSELQHLIAHELQLREGQANDALEKLRNGLAHKALIYRTELRHMTSNDGRTCLHNNLKLIEVKV